jgi:hypothetical protein
MGIHTGWNLCSLLIASPANLPFQPISLFVTAEAISLVDLAIAPLVMGITWRLLCARKAAAAGAVAPAAALS